MRRVAIPIVGLALLAVPLLSQNTPGDRAGDGVEQDDYVSQLGSEGFHPPDALRVDNRVIRNSAGQVVRLPYLKFPRNPEFDK